MSHKYELRIGGNYAGRFNTQAECREFAKANGGYRHGWSVWDIEQKRLVINNGESAVHTTERIHREFDGGINLGESDLFNFSVTIASGIVLIMCVIEFIKYLVEG